MMEEIIVKNPRVLDPDLNEERRLNPVTQSVELTMDPLGTAEIALEDGESVPVRTFIEVYNAKGSCGIYRVNSPEESYGDSVRLSLEHGICALEDAIIPGDGEITGTPRAVLEQIMAHQTTKARGQFLWTLGAVEAPDSKEITVEHDGTKTLEMLTKAVEQMDGYMLRYDQSGFPWVLSVVKKPEEIVCEGRLSRNIRTIRKVVDDAELITRLYCNALESEYIDSDTVGTWGIVEGSVTVNDDVLPEDALAFCQRYIENRKNPTVSIEMDADEWFAMTGEELDRFEVGDMCRVSLPEYGAVIEERIVAIRYTDAQGRPEQATVSLANRITDMTLKAAETENDVDSLKSSSTAMSRRVSSSEKEITNLKATAEGFKEVDDKVVAWFSSVEIDLDATEEGARFGALASYQETFDLFSDVDVRVSEAELVLWGGEGEAAAGLVSRVEDNEARLNTNALEITALSESYVSLKNDTTQALATIGTRMEKVEGDTVTQSAAIVALRSDLDSSVASLNAAVDDNEASITATATSLGSRIDLKADKTYVEDLIADEIEAVKADIELAIADEIRTGAITCGGLAAVGSLSTSNATIGALRLGTDSISKKTIPVVTSFTQALGESAPTQEYTLLTVA